MAVVFVELFETLNELAFVVQVLVFTYTLFWLYITFRDMQLLFGVAGALAGYLIFVHGVSVTLLVVFFVFLVLFGMQIQQLVWFGIGPLLGYHLMGDRFTHVSEMDPMRMQQRMDHVMERMEQGSASQDEMEWLQKHMAQQQMGGAGGMMADQMMRLRMMGMA